MRRVVGFSVMAVLVLGFLSLVAPAPQAAAPCIACPDIPIPSECPTCTQWVPQTCRQCGRCERIKGCKA
jgi:hypothetical protein